MQKKKIKSGSWSQLHDTAASVLRWHLFSAPFYVSGVLGAAQAEIEHHLEMGRKLLAAGQLAEALSHYHSAVGKITQRWLTHLDPAATTTTPDC